MDEVSLIEATRDDMPTIWKMQTEAFSELLDKYEDYDTNPAAESFGKVMARFEQPCTLYYFITVNQVPVGGIRIIDKKDGSRKRISPIWIMPAYRNRGYAQAAILAAEEKHGSDHWCLDTILQESGNLHLYEKMGYHRTGEMTRVNDKMDIVFFEKE